MKLFLVRHGKKETNKKCQFQGRLDISLNLQGKEEIICLREELKKYRFEKIYISPLKRTMETAKIISKGLDYSSALVEEMSLMEMDFGDWEGLTVDEIKNRFPVDYQCWIDDWQTTCIPGGESAEEMFEKICSWITDLQAKHGEEDEILIVTHKGVILQIIAYLLELPLRDIWHFQVDTGSLSIVEIKQGFGILKKLNYKR